MITTETTTTTTETTKTTTAIAAPNFQLMLATILTFSCSLQLKICSISKKSFWSERQSQNFLRLSPGWGCALTTIDERENSRSPA
jgi:hypothetical protein